MKRNEVAEGWPHSEHSEGSSSKFGRSGEWPRISLVTPSYNQGKYLESAILSVLRQGYPNLEYFIMDGNSTDESVDIISRYREEFAGWESRLDRGQAHAINKAWERSTGEFVWWLNSDDMLMPDALFTAVDFLIHRPDIDLVYGDVYRMDDEDRLLGRFNYPDFNFEKFVIEWRDISQAGALARRSGVEAVNNLNEDYHYLMDRDFWIRMALAGRGIAHLDVPLAIFRIHAESKTQAGSEVAAEERVRLTNTLLADPRLPASIQQYSSAVWTNVHLGRARVFIKCGLYPKALQTLFEAFKLRPSVATRRSFLRTFLLSSMGIVFGFRVVERIRIVSRIVRRKSLKSSGWRASGG